MASLIAYVPSYLVQALLKRTAPLQQAYADSFHAVVLFADISGFTALSEVR